MTDQGELGMKSHDEPLFVLRYRRHHVLLRTIFFAFGFIFFGGFTLFPSRSVFDLIFKPAFGFLSLLSARGLIELLSFREISLYNDRIVQIRKFGIPETELKFANATLISSDTRVVGRKSIFDKDVKASRSWLLRTFLFWRIVVYEETLAKPEDVRRFNSLLAYVSGRKILELEGDLDALIKKGSGPRVVTKDTSVEEFLCPEDPQQVAYERSANRAFLVVTLAHALAMVVLCLFIIWWRLR